MEYKDFDDYKNTLEGWTKVIPTIERVVNDYGDEYEIVTDTTEVYEFEFESERSEKISSLATLPNCKKIVKSHYDEREIKKGERKGEIIPEKWILTVVMEHN